jgi:hypothetical protein
MAAIDPDQLAAQLWQEPNDRAYAILDGAAIPNLLDRLYAPPRPEFACLFRGEATPDIAHVAPYLVALDPDSDWLPWIAAGWGRAWGILIVVADELDLGAVRRHLRKISLITRPDGETLLFRYYDPRVLAKYLARAEAAQLSTLFGPLTRVIGEAGEVGQGHVYALTQDGRLNVRAKDFSR